MVASERRLIYLQSFSEHLPCFSDMPIFSDLRRTIKEHPSLSLLYSVMENHIKRKAGALSSSSIICLHREERVYVIPT